MNNIKNVQYIAISLSDFKQPCKWGTKTLDLQELNL